MSGEWWSQPFPPDGTISSAAMPRALGTPSLDPLVVLLREASQNSWDARTADSEQVEIGFSLETMTPQRTARFREILLPGPHNTALTHTEFFDRNAVLLAVSDRGTSGLGGPLRSDAPVEGSADFVNFMRNVGEPRDRNLGGGTYGFGKGILFSVSVPSAILVDTVCVQTRPE